MPHVIPAASRVQVDAPAAVSGISCACADSAMLGLSTRGHCPTSLPGLACYALLCAGLLHICAVCSCQRLKPAMSWSLPGDHTLRPGCVGHFHSGRRDPEVARIQAASLARPDMMLQQMTAVALQTCKSHAQSRGDSLVPSAAHWSLAHMGPLPDAVMLVCMSCSVCLQDCACRGGRAAEAEAAGRGCGGPCTALGPATQLAQPAAHCPGVCLA